jgi:hypothetical protein
VRWTNIALEVEECKKIEEGEWTKVGGAWAYLARCPDSTQRCPHANPSEADHIWY